MNEDKPKLLRVDSLTSLYSQLLGLLAGFSFAGLSIYLAQANLPPRAGDVVSSLFCGFTALVLMSVLYTLLSGDSDNPRAIAALFFYGLPLGLSIATMFYTVALMASGQAELANAVQVARIVVSVVVPFVVFARLGVAASYLRPSGASFAPARFAFVLLIPQLAVDLVGLVWPIQEFRSGVAVMPGYLALSAAVLALATSTLISTRRPDFVPRDRWQHGYLIVSFVGLSAYSLLTSGSLAV